MSFSNAWIGYDNIFAKNISTIFATNSGSEYVPAAVGIWSLADLWMAANYNESVITVDCGKPTQTDYFAVAGHNLGTVSGNLVYEGANNADFSDAVVLVTFAATLPPLYDAEYSYNDDIAYNDETMGQVVSNKVAAWKYEAVTFRYYRARINGSTAAPRIGLLASGMRMEFEIGFYGGFAPPDWNDEAENANNLSDKGIFLGRSIARYGLRPFQISLEPVTHAWVDDVWMPFKRHAQKYPFIFAWGNDPINNRAFTWAKGFMPTKLKNVLHASTGVNCEGTSE